MNEHIKKRALKYVFDNIYSKGFFPQKSFNEFRKENMYFLDGMNIASQMKEYNLFYFYSVCMKVKLPITRNDVKYYFTRKEL